MTSLSANPKIRHILKAVRTVLARHGYAGTTISLVAAEAQISRGLLHYYFKNKEDMMAQAIKYSVETSLGVVATSFEKRATAEDVARGLCRGLRNLLRGDPDFIPLILEGWAVSRRIPAVAEQLNANFIQIQEAVRIELQEAVTRGVICPGISLQELARLLIGIFDGLGVQLVYQPELLSSDEMWHAVETAVRNLIIAEN